MGKEVSLKEKNDSICYLEYRNFDQQEHGAGRCNEKEELMYLSAGDQVERGKNQFSFIFYEKQGKSRFFFFFHFFGFLEVTRVLSVSYIDLCIYTQK